MKIAELIERLTELAEDFPDAEVRLAIQPSWPFEYSIENVVGPYELGEAARERALDRGREYDPEDVDDDPEDVDDEEPLVVYLAEGGQLGYLSGAAKTAAWG